MRKKNKNNIIRPKIVFQQGIRIYSYIPTKFIITFECQNSAVGKLDSLSTYSPPWWMTAVIHHAID